jgi:regulator of nucleoside diphosphate kinase
MAPKRSGAFTTYFSTMKTPLYLSEGDQLRLRSILQSEPHHSPPTSEQKSALENILSRSIVPKTSDKLENRVGFYDRVSLVSATDSRDYFNLQIVMPKDANPDEEQISVLLPVSLAVIGRRCGENVTWDTSHGIREMRIIAVNKYENAVA